MSIPCMWGWIQIAAGKLTEFPWRHGPEKGVVCSTRKVCSSEVVAVYSGALFEHVHIWKLSNQQWAGCKPAALRLRFTCFLFHVIHPMHKHENTGQLGFPASTTCVSKVSAEIKLAYVSFKVLPLLCCGTAANEQIFWRCSVIGSLTWKFDGILPIVQTWTPVFTYMLWTRHYSKE